MFSKVGAFAFLPVAGLALLLATGSPAHAADTSDAGITRAVQSQVKKNLTVDPENISVRTQGGTVTLIGSVRNRQQFQDVQAMAAMTPGVKNVRNDLDIMPLVPGQ